jgi:hypothetical protein
MISTIDYNSLIPLSVRERLNQQHNKMKLEAKYDENGKVMQPYLYVVGLGERHFKNFDTEIQRIIAKFPWLKFKHFRFIMNELVINSQFSMLRVLVDKIGKREQVGGYFFVKIFPCDEFAAVSIEEYGDYFDYFSFLDSQNHQKSPEDMFDEAEKEHLTDLTDLSKDKLKLILTTDHQIVVPDASNKIGLNVIENATDHDFYVTSFYKNGRYMWKRIYFRIENSN